MAADTGTRHYEYIVVGCGGIGSAAVYWLSRRAGKGVLGLEQFQLGHDRGGSQDHSRIIRLSYHDDIYVKLTPSTYEAWNVVEEESGHQLVHKTGCLNLGYRGTPGEAVIEHYAKAMTRQGIPYERLTPSQLRQRFPQFTPSEDTLTLFQPDGGLVDAALANSIHIQLARARGATIEEHCAVTRIDTRPDGTAAVHTTKGTFHCRRVIVTAGAWANQVMGSVGVHVPLKVTQEQVTYFATPQPKKFSKKNFPIFIAHNEYDYYGFPTHVNSCSKIGLDASGPAVTADTRTFEPERARVDKAVAWLKDNIPEFLGPEMYTKTCLYAMTMDRKFVIDTLSKRDKPQVVLCYGAGHAFKFASLFGRILSELAVDGRTMYPIAGFELDRPAVTDPNFVPTILMGKEDLPEETKAKL